MNKHGYESSTSAMAWSASADFHHRFAAFVTDWHIRTIPIAAWGFWLFFLWFPDYWRLGTAGEADLSTAWQMLLPFLHRSDVLAIGVVCVLAYLLYHPVLELAMHGDSPGKRMMNITVVTLEGNPPGARQVLARNAWRAIEFLPFAWLLGAYSMWRSPENARIGDVKSGTRVVMK